MAITLREAVEAMRHRRGMFVGDDRFNTVVAFLTAVAWATDEVDLRGFTFWLYDRYGLPRSNLYFTSLVQQHVGMAHTPYDSSKAEVVDPQENAEACEELLDRLAEYLDADPEVRAAVMRDVEAFYARKP